MNNDSIEAITDSAKAVQEAAKTGGKLIDAADRVGAGLIAFSGKVLRILSFYTGQIAYERGALNGPSMTWIS